MEYILYYYHENGQRNYKFYPNFKVANKGLEDAIQEAVDSGTKVEIGIAEIQKNEIANYEMER